MIPRIDWVELAREGGHYLDPWVGQSLLSGKAGLLQFFNLREGAVGSMTALRRPRRDPGVRPHSGHGVTMMLIPEHPLAH